MSKKNRHKSRPSQRPPGPAQSATATAVANSASDAIALEDVSQNALVDLAGEEALGISAMNASGQGGDGTKHHDAPGTESAAASAHGSSGAGDLDVDASTQAPDHPNAADQAPLASVPPTPAPMASSGDIRGVLIQVAGARLLMPNATIAEVLSYADPEPVGESAPAWLLGRLRWRGWQVPLIAFGTLAGVARERAALGSKVVVLKALAGTSRTPYFAMLTQGFPRLVTVSRQALAVEDGEAATMPQGVQARVRLNEDPALLPDLEAIEALVADAVAQAA